MEIKPLKRIKGVKQSEIDTGDPLGVPTVPQKKISDKTEQLEFVQGRLLYDGKEIGALIRELNQTVPQALSKLAADLEAYKEDCLKKRRERRFLFLKRRSFSADELTSIFGLCDTFIAMISELIKNRFDQTKDGITLTFDEHGQLILNGMNVHALIAECQANPNPKSMMFLKGVRARLDRVLHNRIDSRNYERLREVILGLFVEIDSLLD